MNADRPTLLYRVYNEADELLYIGISIDVRRRLVSHSAKKWWPEAPRIVLSGEMTREAALVAEAKAIRDELPTQNVVHRPGSTRSPYKPRTPLAALRQRLLAQPPTTFDDAREALNRVWAEIA